MKRVNQNHKNEIQRRRKEARKERLKVREASMLRYKIARKQRSQVKIEKLIEESEVLENV